MNKPLSIDTSFFTDPQTCIEQIEDSARAAIFRPICDMIMEKFNQVATALEYMHDNQERLGVQWLQLNETALNAERLYSELFDLAFIENEPKYTRFIRDAKKRMAAIDEWSRIADDVVDYPRLLTAEIVIQK